MVNIDQNSGKPETHRTMWSTIVVLVVVGLTLTTWRYVVEPGTAAAPGDYLWDVELTIRPEATAGKTTVDIAAPLNTRQLRIFGQNIVNPGWHQSFRPRDQAEPARRITFVASRDGELSIDAVFNVHASAAPRPRKDDVVRSLEVPSRDSFLKDHPFLQIEHREMVERAAELVAYVDDDGSRADVIFDFVRTLRQRVTPSLRAVAEVLADRRANDRERAYVTVALCRAARIPARLVRGIVLKELEVASAHFLAGGASGRPLGPV